MSELEICFLLFWHKDKKGAVFGTKSDFMHLAFCVLNSLIADEQKEKGKSMF